MEIKLVWFDAIEEHYLDFLTERRSYIYKSRNTNRKYRPYFVTLVICADIIVFQLHVK